MSIYKHKRLFKEGDNVIAYCPSLNLSDYGATQKQAKDSFAIVFKRIFGLQFATRFAYKRFTQSRLEC